MTVQRRVIARVLSDADDHPNAEEIGHRSVAMAPKISVATVYRTLRIFEGVGILQRLEFGEGRSRYEMAEQDHHDHLIDTSSGKVLEFQNAELENLQEKVLPIWDLPGRSPNGTLWPPLVGRTRQN